MDRTALAGYDPCVRFPELGLAYFKNRFYDPALGRFLSPDPLGMVDGPNLYAYVLNDPINNVDPWGLEEIESNESEPVTILGIRLRGRASGSSGGIGSVGDSCPAFEANANDTGILPTSGCARGRGGPRGGEGAGPPICNQQLLDLANSFASLGNSFDSTGDKALIIAGGVAVVGAVFSATGVGLPPGVTAGAVAGALATAGTITKGVGSVLSVGAHVVAISATGNYSLAGPAIFSGVAGILPFKLGPVSSYFQDKVSGAASQIVGFGNIPESCPE